MSRKSNAENSAKYAQGRQARPIKIDMYLDDPVEAQIFNSWKNEKDKKHLFIKMYITHRANKEDTRKVIKINIDGHAFLIREGNYEIPTFIQQHREAILLHVNAGKKFASDPLTDHFEGLPDLTNFKKLTGIIGYPLTSHDTNLYILDNKPQIELEINI